MAISVPRLRLRVRLKTQIRRWIKGHPTFSLQEATAGRATCTGQHPQRQRAVQQLQDPATLMWQVTRKWQTPCPERDSEGGRRPKLPEVQRGTPQSASNRKEEVATTGRATCTGKHPQLRRVGQQLQDPATLTWQVTWQWQSPCPDWKANGPEAGNPQA